ncbi:hypothetical protein LZ32DRAFT_658476 [Colletotrichum eremochloae]|nr:hypothetical protein LZ32DRAFT_658476 [Colletotrichum eremochloae]
MLAEKESGTYDLVPPSDESSDGSYSEEAILMQEGFLKRKSRAFSTFFKGFCALAVAVLYSIALVQITLHTAKAGRMQGTRFMESLANDFITYESRVFHQFERPYQNLTYFTKPGAEVDRNWHNLIEHHCLHMLREAVMCQGDTTIVTMKWNATGLRPIGNFTSPHECVNWNRLMEWVVPNSFDALADGALVHPTLGPVFKDRQLVDTT